MVDDNGTDHMGQCHLASFIFTVDWEGRRAGMREGENPQGFLEFMIIYLLHLHHRFLYADS